MLKIEIKKIGTTDIEKMVQESMSHRVKERLGDFVCPVHNKGISVVLDGGSLTLSGCCEESKSKAQLLLS